MTLLKLFFAWGIRGLIFFVILTLIYLVARWLQEQEERQRLAEEYKQQKTTLSKTLKWEAYLDRGMDKYETSWKRRSLWLILLTPLLAVFAIILLAFLT